MNPGPSPFSVGAGPLTSLIIGDLSDHIVQRLEDDEHIRTLLAPGAKVSALRKLVQEAPDRVFLNVTKVVVFLGYTDIMHGTSCARLRRRLESFLVTLMGRLRCDLYYIYVCRWPDTVESCYDAMLESVCNEMGVRSVTLSPHLPVSSVDGVWEDVLVAQLKSILERLS